MNSANLIGRLVRDTEVRYTQDGTAVAHYTLAVDRKQKREGQPEADFIRILAFGKSAEFAGKYFLKGMRVGVTGHIQTGSYKDKDGRTVNTFEVVVDGQDFADSRQNQGQAPAQTQTRQASRPVQQKVEDVPDFIETDEDMPF